jgi:tetratricopeptide (TPR) repeat protein
MMTCAEVTRDEVVERYVAGTLTRDELDAFEEHLLACERCQDEVRLGAAIRETLAAGAGVGRGAAVHAFPRRAWLPIAGLAAAAAIAGIVVLPRLSGESEVEALGRVTQAPIWLGVPVRADEPPTADSLFETAMAAYDEGRWDDAARGLEAALEAGADPVPAGFFLGAAHLMADRPGSAAEALGAVIDHGETPYLAEALYYRAKALLLQERAERALADLDAAARAGGAVGDPARALADSVRSLRSR